MNRMMSTRISRSAVLIVFVCHVLGSAVSLAAKGGRTPTYARNGMVVTTSHLASQVGCDILQNGGNVIDAAVATAFALAVTWPAAGNIGGGGFLLYHSGDGKTTSIDFREKAPLAATETMFLDKAGNIHHNSNHEGFLAIGVPGTVAGLYKAHSLYGRMAWSELLQPAIELATEGFELTWGIYNSLNSEYTKKRLLKYPATEAIFYPDNQNPLQPGRVLRQPVLAKTLRRIQSSGHDGFYSGETADKLSQFIQKNSGLITKQDLLQYQAVERKPVQGSYRGFDIHSMPLPSSGGITLITMLNILEGYQIAAPGYNSAAYLHLLTESMRRAYANRARYLGDSDFNPDIPIDTLLSKTHANRLRSQIDTLRASISDSAQFNDYSESEETTHISIASNDGSAVSLTYTLEYSFGSGIVAEGLGFLLNNEMGDFNAVPGLTDKNGRIGTKANLIQPGKRMLSSMTPTIVTKNGVPVLVLGSPGGRTIINTVLQVILNFIDYQMNVAQAVEAPRIHHQWLPDITSFEAQAFSPDTERLYKDMGHKVRYRKQQGRTMAIAFDEENDVLAGAADSRSPDGKAVGY